MAQLPKRTWLHREQLLTNLLGYQHLSVDDSVIGVDEALERDVVLDILWRRDGAPAMYESEDNPNTALNWAEYIGLIDGGSSHCSAQIIQLLSDIGLKNLDYFVLSHPHADHIG